MTSSDPNAAPQKRESLLALSVMFFAIAFLSFLLGWAQGVRHDTKYLHIPENAGWLIAAGVLAAIGALFLIVGRSSAKRR